MFACVCVCALVCARACVCACGDGCKEYKHVRWQHVICVYSLACVPVCNCVVNFPPATEHHNISLCPRSLLSSSLGTKRSRNATFHQDSSTHLHLPLSHNRVAFSLKYVCLGGRGAQPIIVRHQPLLCICAILLLTQHLNRTN